MEKQLISASDLKTLFNDNAFLLYAKRYTKKVIQEIGVSLDKPEPEYDFGQFICSKGNNFEAKCYEHIINLNNDGDCIILSRDYKKCATSEGRKELLKRTKKCLDRKIPIIFEAYLQDDEIYGFADILIRNDYMIKCIKNLPEYFIKDHKRATSNGEYFYTIIDCKLTTIHVGVEKLNNYFMLSNHKHYFVQLAVYHRILGKLQKFNPNYSCILGHQMKVRKSILLSGDSFNAFGFFKHNSEIEEFINSGIIWIQNMRKNGGKWTLLPEPSDDRIYPKFTGKQYDGSFSSIKKAYHNKLYPNSQELEVDFPNNLQNLSLSQKAQNLLNKDIIFCLDNENVKNIHTDSFSDLSIVGGIRAVYMIGVVLYKNNKLIERKQFIAEELTTNSVFNMYQRFNNYIMSRTNNLKNDYGIFHWHSAELTDFRHFIKSETRSEELQFFSNFDKNKFIDLKEIFKKEKIKVPCKGFGLKPVTKCFYKHGLIDINWEDNGMDGANSISAAVTYYTNKQKYQHFMDIVSRYNFIDCESLWALRTQLLKFN